MGPRNSPPVEELLAHTGLVRSLARGALGKDDGSEDVAQDAMLAALENGPAEPRAARSWFYRVVTNRVASLRRRDAAQRRYQRGVRPPPVVPSPAEILVREESRRQLVRALLQLDAMYREPLVLRYYEDLPPRAIAKRLGLPVETVRTRLRRGVERLRDALDVQYGSRRDWVVALVPLISLPPGSTSAPVPAADAALGALTSKVALVGVIAVGAIVAAVSWGGRTNSEDAALTGEPHAAAPAEAARASLRGATPQDASVRGASTTPSGRSGAAGADGGPFVIRVLDYDGLPVVGAELRVAEMRREWAFDWEAIRGRTDAEGLIYLPRTATPPPGANIPAATFRLQVTQPRDREDLQDLEIENWRPDDAILTLSRGFVIDGGVIDRAGNPVPGALVSLQAGPRSRTVEADRLGLFRVSGLSGSRWRTRVHLHYVRSAPAQKEWVLDGGSRGVRLEVAAGRGMLVKFPEYDPLESSHRRLELRVTERDPMSESEGMVSQHPVSADGSIWLYGVEEGRQYALWWGPDHEDRYAYEPGVSTEDGPVTLSTRQGLTIRLEAVRPAGWTNWPVVRARAPGIEVFGRWTGDGECEVKGLPNEEFLVTAQGSDASGREVYGELSTRPGRTDTLTISLR